MPNTFQHAINIKISKIFYILFKKDFKEAGLRSHGTDTLKRKRH